MPLMADWFTVTSAEKLGPQQRDVFDIEGYYIAVFNVDGTYYAFEDMCTHDEGPLAEGVLEGYEIECERHGAKFDIRTGKAVKLPAVTPTRRFEVRIHEGDVQIAIDPED
jgi:3-phenylpropionate/trans-cinnamate dioxygenase ferredoxin subunit